MEEQNIHEVRFDIWCEKCKHHEEYECDDPCNECLAQGWNENSTKPVHFAENEKVD